MGPETEWGANGKFLIEDKAILADHGSSWIVRYLEEHGFTDDTPEYYYRQGPWLWIDANTMTYRYHPRWAVGIGTPIANIQLTGKDFAGIWEIIEKRKRKNAKLMENKWESRMASQEEEEGSKGD